jgi:pilus assembly protein Flp/PilA
MRNFKMGKIIASFARDESGAAAAEYALILAIVAAGIAVAVTALGTSISTAVTNAAGYLNIPAV